MGDEPGSQVLQRGGDALLQGEQGARAVLNGGAAPALQPAVGDLRCVGFGVAVLLALFGCSLRDGVVGAGGEAAGMRCEE